MTRIRNSALPLVALVLIAAAPVAQASEPDGLRPVLQTRFGAVIGRNEGKSGQVRVYRGIRYAASTQGRRFERAIDPQPWSTPVDAGNFGFDCPQPTSGEVPVFASWANPRGMSEDCLFLNVWTRGKPGDGKKRPIMVWLHGGGYVTGSGSSHG